MKTMEDTCSQFIDAFSDMFKFMIKKLYQSYNFDTCYLVFDGLSVLMIQIKDNNQAIEKLASDIFPELNEIIMKNHHDLLSYAFQIYALAIHFYNLSVEGPKVY